MNQRYFIGLSGIFCIFILISVSLTSGKPFELQVHDYRFDVITNNPFFKDRNALDNTLNKAGKEQFDIKSVYFQADNNTIYSKMEFQSSPIIDPQIHYYYSLILINNYIQMKIIIQDTFQSPQQSKYYLISLYRVTENGLNPISTFSGYTKNVIFGNMITWQINATSIAQKIKETNNNFPTNLEDQLTYFRMINFDGNIKYFPNNDSTGFILDKFNMYDSPSINPLVFILPLLGAFLIAYLIVKYKLKLYKK